MEWEYYTNGHLLLRFKMCNFKEIRLITTLLVRISFLIPSSLISDIHHGHAHESEVDTGGFHRAAALYCRLLHYNLQLFRIVYLEH